MNNYQLSEKLNEIACMCEYTGESVFKISAYLKAAEIIASLDTELYEYENDFKIDGIGRGIKEIILEFFDYGRSAYYDELKSRVPRDIFLMLSISGIGVKKLKTLCDELSIDGIDDLLLKARTGAVRKIKGFSEAGELNIIKEINRIKSQKNVKLFFAAEKLFIEIKHRLSVLDFIKEIQPANEFARKLPVLNKLECSLIIGAPVSDLNEIARAISVTLEKHEYLIDKFDGGAVMTIVNYYSEFSVVFYLIVQGIDTHNIQKLLMFSPRYLKTFFKIRQNDGNTSGNNSDVIKTRRSLNVSYIQKKADIDEIDEIDATDETDMTLISNLARGFDGHDFLRIAPHYSQYIWKKIPASELELLRPFKSEKIKGIFHIHSVYSDGADTLDNIAAYSKEMGLEYAGVSDHSKSSPYAGGLSAERLLSQIKEIDALNLKYAPFKIFKGIECDILKDGSLDYDGDILKQLDFVIVSVHSNFKMPREEMSERIVKAISNPYTTMLGHISGRLLTKRAGYEINEEAIFEAAAKNNVIIELNCNPYRMDVDYKYFKRLSELGVMISLNPDAHSICDAMPCVNYGVNAVNLGAMPENYIFNVKSAEEISNFFNFKKETAVKNG